MKSLRFLTEGYRIDPSDAIGAGIFDDETEGMVVVRDIEFYSMCEHHLLPFFGRAHIAYLPNSKIIAISQLPGLVDAFAHRLQVQERLTRQIADAIMKALSPHGVAVITLASHLCMMMRGVQKQSSSTYTSAFRGAFETDPQYRDEFLRIAIRASDSH